ncbi:hypothetical protein GIB67_003337 [Kingdonia uniflora]|uniref:P-type ATPase A domain-containing protein n=1 Tax=Kingdonia uniflora TaxID=39325 RepID=A0A7J7P8W6_9MAGN|nr:hypothetical protein GIB67_003337 [Kingdonia uniflora]
MQFKYLDRQKKNIFAKVTRDGYSQTVPKTDLVVGDVVHLFTRDNIPDDGIYIYGSMLLIDESSLTGESDPVHVNRYNPFLLSGTTMQDGKVVMLVTIVGMSTEWGRLMDTLNDGGDDETPLQVKLNGVITIIAKFGLVFAFLSFVVLMTSSWRGTFSIKATALQFMKTFKPIFLLLKVNLSNLEYLNKVLRLEALDISKEVKMLSLPLSNLAKGIMNMIGAYPVQLNWNMWEVAHLVKGIWLRVEEEKSDLMKVKVELENQVARAKANALKEEKKLEALKASHAVAIGHLEAKARVNLEELEAEHERLGCHLILKGYSEDEVDAIEADTYVEEGDD